MGDQIPHPVTREQEFLAAIFNRLGEVLDRLPERPPERTDGTVELTEPQRPTRAKAQPTAAGTGAKREPAGGRGSPRPAPRRKPAAPKKPDE